MKPVLTLTTPEMSPDTLQERSYGFARDKYFEAEAIADAALGNLADFVSRVELWGAQGEAEKQIEADLRRKLDEAEKTRSQMLTRLEWEMANYIRYVTSPDHEEPR